MTPAARAKSKGIPYAGRKTGRNPPRKAPGARPPRSRMLFRCHSRMRDFKKILEKKIGGHKQCLCLCMHGTIEHYAGYVSQIQQAIGTSTPTRWIREMYDALVPAEEAAERINKYGMETIRVAHGGTVHDFEVKEVPVSDTFQYWIYDWRGREIYRIMPELDKDGMPAWTWLAFAGAEYKIGQTAGEFLSQPDQSLVDAIGDSIEKLFL